MEPLISVVVPVYKVEQYLDKCVNSLLNQTYRNLEIILVDDGSPDSCPQLCDEYANKYENVVTYHKSNGGLGDARNYGVERAKGQYIAFVDSDDYVEPEYIKALWRLMQKYSADISITGTVRGREDSSVGTEKGTMRCDCCASGAEMLFNIYSGNLRTITVSACGKLYKRETLLRFPFPNGFHEDSAVMYRILDACKTAAFNDCATTYHYIYREGSILRRNLTEKHFIIFDICREFESFIEKEHPDMRVLSVLFYRRSVAVMLNTHCMDRKTYDSLFLKYRELFRKNLWSVLKDKRVSGRIKCLMLLYSTSPFIYKLNHGPLKTALRFIRGK